MNDALTKAYVSVANSYRERYRELVLAGNERGLTTTEIAVLTFVLVTAAAVVGGLLIAYSRGTVEALPDNPTELVVIPD